MGDNFLKQQIKNFEKSTDLAADALERPKLIRRSEVSTRRYRAKPRPGESIADASPQPRKNPPKTSGDAAA